MSRNTVYRRLENLEDNGIIKKRIMAVPDFEKMGFQIVIIGLNVGIGDVDEVVDYLKGLDDIKFLWKTYTDFEIVAVLVCDKRNVGTCINSLKNALSELDVEVDDLSAFPSISWEKIDFSPFGFASET